MVAKEQLKGTPMYEALYDLAQQMQKEHMPPVELNVIGGFALMLHGVRPAGDVTDIDYVGSELPQKLENLIETVGRAHNMEPGWINKDGMAVDISMDAFELSTGKLNFQPALTVGDIQINVLEEKDLLRLKIIAVDTSMAELEATGEFSRMKDFHDIHTLMQKLQMRPEDVVREYADYMICYPDTGDLIHAIAKDGPNGGLKMIEAKRNADSFVHGSYEDSIFSGLGGTDDLLKSLNSFINNLKGREQ